MSALTAVHAQKGRGIPIRGATRYQATAIAAMTSASLNKAPATLKNNQMQTTRMIMPRMLMMRTRWEVVAAECTRAA